MEHIAKRAASLTGRLLSDEHRRKLAAIPRTVEWREKIRQTLTGRKHTEEEKKKIRDSVHRAYATEEVKAKFRNRVAWNKGKAWSEKIRKEMSIRRKGKSNVALIGRPRADWVRKILSSSHIGIMQSEETKRKRSATLKGRATVPPERRNYGPDHHNWGKPAYKGAGIGKGSYCLAGHYVRSTWERGVADYLYLNEIAYEYETHLFDLGDGLRFRPDFYLTKYDVWVEVKGYETERDAEKFSRFIKKGHRLIIIDKHVWRFFEDTGIMAFGGFRTAV